MEQKNNVKTMFMSKLEAYRDATTWGNFHCNFNGLSFQSKLDEYGESLIQKIIELEDVMISEFLSSLSDAEVEEWMLAADAKLEKQRKRFD